jgi:CRP-like cAMP-binding protein
MSAAPGVAAGVLAALPLFRQTPRSQVALLARESRTTYAARGAVIARRGERLPGLAAVAYGLVKLSLKGEHEKVLRLVGPGECFGEAVLFLDRPLPVDISALADTLLVVVPEKPLLALLDSDPRFARGLLASLCQRLHALVADFEATTMHGARERLAAYLDSLADPGTAGATARLPAAKTVVAARLGMTKETLSRLLHRLAAEGLIAVNRREITLLDRAGLAALARPA